ncbi:hypothetical protein DVA86_31405 [Streptomyces armeniacus]|uniref:Uncharacterized protein n=1 Tax=Streptomyces armeniacus TaxID=83291 RepID=A0A345XXQ7_9ACTN|nr:hypothetical protein DVA86_31405 [Streptomyces armeniacus]
MASTPPKVRHHQRATPSVCGRAWHIRARGAPTIRMTVRATRTTYVTSKATIDPARTMPRMIRKMLPLSSSGFRMKSRSASPAVPSSTPSPMTAWESALARLTAFPARSRERAEARKPSGMRGAISFTECRRWMLSWLIRTRPAIMIRIE